MTIVREEDSQLLSQPQHQPHRSTSEEEDGVEEGEGGEEESDGEPWLGLARPVVKLSLIHI